MTAPPSDSLRASALALLADGNRPESVAQVLGVPIEQLVRSDVRVMEPMSWFI